MPHRTVPAVQGIFTPNVVPLDQQGRIDEDELRRYVDWLIDQGVHGLYPNGSTGEFTRFTAEERRRITQIVTHQAAGRAVVLAGAAEANVRETLAACELYREYGARAAAIVAPYYFRSSPDAVLAYFREIARSSPLGILLYNIPQFASPIDVDTVCRLAEMERVIGLKDSTGDLTAMLRMIDKIRPQRPEFSFLSGWETTLVPMLVMGCDGGVNATSGVMPDYFRKLYDLTQEGDISQARAMQVAILEFFDAAVLSVEFPHGIRTAVALRGFKIGRSRQPQGDAELAAWPQIEQRIGQALAHLGYPPN